jgi:DNA-directed RNA polymerase subunit RPC12/RpoP
MPVTRCPYCRSTVEVPNVAGTVRCPNPNCRRFFDRDPLQDVMGEAEFRPIVPRATSLTSPHTCHQCGHRITVPTGAARSTILCPSCSRPTSVYAVLHYCIECEALLESPLGSAGSQVACPRCRAVLMIPRDGILKKTGAATTDESWYGFACPRCAGQLEAERRQAGKWAVCPHCLWPFHLPDHGYPLPTQPKPRKKSPGHIEMG